MIDLAGGLGHAYEHPTPVRQRVRLRTPGDAFGDHQAAPLSRTAHRVKTFLGYRLTQVGPLECVWTTPCGLHRHVGPTGTHELTDHDAAALNGDQTRRRPGWRLGRPRGRLTSPDPCQARTARA